MEKPNKETILIGIIAFLLGLLLGIGIWQGIGLNKIEKMLTSFLITNGERKEIPAGEMLGALFKNDTIIFKAIGIKEGEKTLKELIEELNK